MIEDRMLDRIICWNDQQFENIPTAVHLMLMCSVLSTLPASRRLLTPKRALKLISVKYFVTYLDFNQAFVDTILDGLLEY